MNVLDFQKRKEQKKKISMVTCYDYWSAKILNETNVDVVLVGDSAASVMHGYDSTVHGTVEMMVPYINAVSKGAKNKFIIGDMPFLSFRKGLTFAMSAVEQFIKAGAHSIKLEGVDGHEDIIKHVVGSGVPVMGHLGFTPQSINGFGGNYVQGRGDEAADKIIQQAKKLEELGCYSLVLECVPAVVAKEVTMEVGIPTIGIGAGPDCDGQVLVLQDLLGMDKDFNPKFLRKYLNGYELIKDAVDRYVRDVEVCEFPNQNESH